MKVAVCAITFRRPEGLRRLLRGLDALTFRSDAPEVEIVIVDNDPGSSARTVCDALRSEVKWPLRYDVEPRRGIPFARNKAVACAIDVADFIAFIDDDEVPEPSWLDELLRVQRLEDADVVTGPVVPEFPEEVPAWIVKGRFFESPRHPTGQRRDVAYTHNVVVRNKVFRVLGDWFDERLALTGGEDSHLFRRAQRAGFSIVWADDALVSEWIPKSRACSSWLIQRFYRVGSTRGLISIRLGSPWLSRLILAAKAGVWGVVGVVVAPCGLVSGRHVFVTGGRYMAYAGGMFVSIFGGQYEEYRTTHGT